MKKALVWLLALLMIFSSLPVSAETAGEKQLKYDYDELTVGSITPFDGSFFTQMWGNVVSDTDIRSLIHGYNLVEWRFDEGVFGADPSVVSGSAVTENAAGDRTYLITLADDLYYSDGSAITAWDYAFSMLLSFAPEIAQIGGDIRKAEYLLGYWDYVQGNTPYLAGVRVLADRMLSLTVSHEYLPFFYEIGWLDCIPYPIGQIAPGCQVKDDGKGVYIDNREAFTAELLQKTILDPETGYRSHPAVTSGPYKLVSFADNRVELEINPYYKGNSHGVKPSIPRLVFKTVDGGSAIDALAAGDVMLLNKLVSADSIQQGIQLMAENDAFASSSYPRSGLSFIGFCCERPIVSSAAVRQAIAMCLDKEALVKDAVGSFGLRVDGYYGIGQWMYQMLNGTLEYPEGDEQAWKELSLEDVPVYDLDTEAAVKLLESEGWSLNRQGQPFRQGTDDVRCKSVDGTVIPLELALLCAQESSVPQYLPETFVQPLAEAGIALSIEAAPVNDVMQAYYRQSERDCDMILLATNFDMVFDPSLYFQPDGEGVNVYNTTAINDEKLYELAVDMRKTEPGDLLAYCSKWIALQQRFAEVLPAIPVYSNMYFDFYPRVLHNYNILESITCGQAILEAYLGDAEDLTEGTEE